MKVQNTAIFMGENTKNERHDQLKDTKNVFAGSLNQDFDPIVQKKQLARKKAMKIVGDAWAGERKLDEDLEKRRNKVKEYQSTMGTAKSAIRQIEEERTALRDSYGISEDSQEEQDLRLLEKKEDAEKLGSGVELTEEEKERLAQIEEAGGPTVYQQRSLEMRKSEEPYEEEITSAEKGLYEENYAIREMKLARLKSQTMLKANQSAEDVMEAASDEIIGMLTQEAVDHMDEEMEEKKEAAEKKAEEKEAEEEKLEKRKEEKAETEEFTEQVLDVSRQVGDMDGIQREIRKMMEEMKLVEEDIKGAGVDTTA